MIATASLWRLTCLNIFWEKAISRDEYLRNKANNQEARLIYQRYYPFGASFTHLLGYLGPVSEEELKENNDCGAYSPDDWKGEEG